MAYSADYDGWAPSPYNRNSSKGRWYPYMWVNTLFVTKHISAKNCDLSRLGSSANSLEDHERVVTDILACPSTNQNDIMLKGWSLGNPSRATGDYGVNDYMGTALIQTKESTCNDGYRMSLVKVPSRTFCLTLSDISPSSRKSLQAASLQQMQPMAASWAYRNSPTSAR